MAFDTGGAATGALSGAAAGTAIMPGIGTAIGAIGGGLFGGFFGGEQEAAMSEEEKQVRRMQMANLQQLQNQASGKVASAAQPMIEHNRAENAARMVGTAKTLGGDPALANRMAADGIARGNAEAAYQGTILRAQEQQAAQQQLNQALGQARGPDAAFSAMQTGVGLEEAARRRQMYGDMLNNAGQVVGGFF